MPKNVSDIQFVPVQPAVRPSIAKSMAYGPSTVQTVNDAGGFFRQDRGRIYRRAGVPVKVLPQFKGVQIAINSSSSAALPTTSTTAGTVASYPTGTRPAKQNPQHNTN